MIASQATAIKAILFDRDGTLLDLQATWAGSVYCMFEDLSDGQPEQMQALADYTGYCLESRSFDLTSRLLVSPPTDYLPVWAEIVNRTYDEKFLELFEALSLKHCSISPTLLPGARETIVALAEAGIPLGIATNGTESSAYLQMEKLDLVQHFCFIAGYDSGYGKKPEPGPILGFAKSLNIKPEDVLMVGDSLHDIHAAHAAGTPNVALPTGAGSRKELLAEADLMIENLTDLPPMLGITPTGTAPSPRPPHHAR